MIGEMISEIGGILAGICMAAFLLTGCQNEMRTEVFDRELVETEGLKAIEFFNERDYQSVLDMGSEELKESITAEQFAGQCDPMLDERGEFQEIKKTVFREDKEENPEEVYGSLLMVGVYEGGKIQFSIAFDENMKLVRFLVN